LITIILNLIARPLYGCGLRVPEGAQPANQSSLLPSLRLTDNSKENVRRVTLLGAYLMAESVNTVNSVIGVSKSIHYCSHLPFELNAEVTA